MNITFQNTAIAALALTLAVPATLTTTTQSVAGSRDAFVGGVVGGIIGGAIGSSRSRQRTVYVERAPVYREPVVVERRVVVQPSGNAHTNWCYRKYRSYDARTDTYVSYGGRVKYCNSPYN
ncbi:MAG: BA14K family protein [Pseudomonadota bacterium]